MRVARWLAFGVMAAACSRVEPVRPAATAASVATATPEPEPTAQPEAVPSEAQSGSWSEQPGGLAAAGGQRPEFFCYRDGHADEPDDVNFSCFTTRTRCDEGYRTEQGAMRADPRGNVGRRLTPCASTRTAWCTERVGITPPFVCRPTRTACELARGRIRGSRLAANTEVTACEEHWLR